jgi:anti-sigma B factor antagonist
MALKLTTRVIDGVTVVDLSGRLVLGTESSAFRDALAEVSAGGAARILLNLKDLSFIDSSGLGELVAGHVNARHGGGALKIAAVPIRVLELLEMTGIDSVLDIHEDVASAHSSFRLKSSGR